MAAIVYVILAMMLGAQSAGPNDRAAIQAAEDQQHSAPTRLTSVLISGGYAVARGTGGIHDGLLLTPGGWRVVCRLGAGLPSAGTLKHKCGFSLPAASQLAADEMANAAASQGEFTSAVRSERIAYHFAPAPMRPSESARLQLLNQLNQQMEIGQITRANAIRKWNELRLSVYLP